MSTSVQWGGLSDCNAYNSKTMASRQFATCLPTDKSVTIAFLGSPHINQPIGLSRTPQKAALEAYAHTHTHTRGLGSQESLAKDRRIPLANEEATKHRSPAKGLILNGLNQNPN